MLYSYWDRPLEQGYRQTAESPAEHLRLRRSPPSARVEPVLFPPHGAVVQLLLMMGLNGKTSTGGLAHTARSRAALRREAHPGRLRPSAAARAAPPRRRGLQRVPDRTGRPEGLPYDLKTAAQGWPTGNGERGLFSPPTPSFSNLVVEAGTTPIADIIAGLDEALLVEGALGLGQGNVISGAFSNSLSLGFKIEKGKIVGRVKNVSIAGNIYEDLKRVDAISQEREWVYGGMHLPYLLLPELNVVSKG